MRNEMAKRTARKNDTTANLGFEAKLWAAADALRNNMDAAEYKHVVLGLIFLKYISDAFEGKHAELEAQKAQGADPEDRDEYRAASIFWVPKEARWQHLKASAPQPTIGTLVDEVPVLLQTERRITDAGLAQIGSGLLPAGTVLLSSRAPIGYLAIVEVPTAINQGFIAIKSRAGVSNLFMLFCASACHDEIVSRANGSTFLEISKASFRPIPAVTLPAPVMQVFDSMVRPLYERIVRSARETHTLTTLRDTLLPKLISGELRVTRAASPNEATA
jgi:hypothetical protein